MAEKDFGPIESDYAFFSANSTEPENDAAAYARTPNGFASARESIQMLDFGCGTGEFTERLLTALAFPPRALRLSLIEPVRHQVDAAPRRLARFSDHPIATAQRLATGATARFDLIVSNHALYYVEDLDATLRGLVASLAPGGILTTSIAPWENVLVALWTTGFGQIGEPVPYHAAQDVGQSLARQGVAFHESRVPYRLRFPDTTENRTKILRFLFADHLARMPQAHLLAEFDRHVRDGHVDIDTSSTHFDMRLA